MGLDSRDYYRPAGYGGFSFFPPMLKKLIIANVAVFFFQMIFDNLLIGGYPGAYLLNRYLALNPLSGFDAAGMPNNFQIWQLITYQFMHANFSHILFNMFALWIFGMEIENMMGSKRFLIFYLTAGVGAGLLQILVPWIMGEGMGSTIGASGAVYGVMVAFALFFPDRYIFIYFLLPIKAKYLIVILMIFEFFSVGDMSLVAHFAHIGGAVTGFLFILLDKHNTFSLRGIFDNFKKVPGGSKDPFRRHNSAFGSGKHDIEDATFYEINDKKKDEDDASQEEIDRILDKISQSGYQNLTEREKRILFEASKKK